jgi:hypothetical protein
MSLWQAMLSTFNGAFVYHGLTVPRCLLGIGLGLAFGAVWLALYRPPLLRERWLWAVGAVSAFLTWAAIAFVQVPLQTWVGELLQHFWAPLILNHWLLLASVPAILLSGIVQEASKLATVIGFRWWRGEGLSVRTVVLAGAVAGAGFGIFEAVWVHNSIFASGWTWGLVTSQGYTALLGFWERFFSVGFHIAASTLAAWGLAKGMGWRFYLLAALLHGIVNYGVVLLHRGLLTPTGVEIYIAALAVLATLAALRLRSRTVEEDRFPSPPPATNDAGVL